MHSADPCSSTCYSMLMFYILAGMVALGAEGSDNKEKYVSIGAELANTCHESYIRTGE